MAKRGFTGAMMQAFGARDHTVTVTDTSQIAPHVRRIRFHSETLFDEAEAVPTAWLRFWFPGADDREFQRAYTITEADTAAGDFAVDVVLHDPSGPASAWAKQAEPGMSLAVATLSSSKFVLPDELPAGYLLIGDSASIPAINSILATVPHEVPLEVYLEEHEPDDHLIPLTSHPRAHIHWVPRRGPESLAAAIEDRDWSNWYAWLGPESGSLKHLRTRLREGFGFPKTEMYVQAYWVEGKEMGKSRGPAAVSPETEIEPTGPILTSTHPDPSAEPRRPAPPSTTQGSWRAQAGGRLLAPLRPYLILAGVLQALVTLLQLAPFVLLVELAQRLLTGAATGQLWALGLWAVGLMGVGILGASALLLWLHALDARFARGVRQRLLTKLGRLPLGWYDARSSGEVKQIVSDDTLALHYLVTHAVADAVAAVVAPLVVLAYLVVIDWRLALLLFLPVLVYIVTMWIMIVRSGAKIAEASRWAERMNVEAGSYLTGQPVVRVFGGAAASTFRTRLAEYIGFLNDWQRPFVRQKTLMDLSTRPATFLLLIVVFGTLFITAGSMDPAAILPFLLLGTTFGARLLGIGYGLGGLRAGFIAARRIQVTLDSPELTTSPSGSPVNGATRQVRFADVGFSYTAGVPVLHGIDLTLEPGTVTALVGSSGSGKSTLAALLARFHDVETGRISIGGRDIRELTADELYARVGFVFQQTQLVQGTVRENIALAVPDAPLPRVEQAARAAQLHERIMAFPQGYDTVLGPDAALSGGERQRLTIARAILADTPVLVLDEATAYSDPESEFGVQQALNRLTAGRTVLVIAHRLHTITGVDQIVVLDHGRIVQTGRHEELIATEGRYRQLWEASGSAKVRTR